MAQNGENTGGGSRRKVRFRFKSIRRRENPGKGGDPIHAGVEKRRPDQSVEDGER